MLIPLIFDDRAASLSRVPPQSGQALKVDRPIHEGPDVRLQRFPVLGEDRPLDPRDQPLVGHVDAVDLHPHRFVVEEVVQLRLCVLANRLVRVEDARVGVGHHREEALRGPPWDGDGALGERPGVVEELCEVRCRRRCRGLRSADTCRRCG